jgi:hypothetical protein
MSGGGDNGWIVKQLRTTIEEDRQVIRKLQEEVDRLRYLLALHPLRNSKPPPASLPPLPTIQKLHIN